MNNFQTFQKKSKLIFEKTEKKGKNKKIMIFGLDGSGKSYFANKYCEDHGLNEVVFDFDQTNFSTEHILKIPPLRTAKQYTEYFCTLLEEIDQSIYDTVVFDNIMSFFELITSDSKGLAKFSERSQNWKKIKLKLMKSNLNVIFIGQIDTDIEQYIGTDTKPSSIIASVHSLCNEKYFCEYNKSKGFTQTIRKYRGKQEIVGLQYEEVEGNGGTEEQKEGEGE